MKRATYPMEPVSPIVDIITKAVKKYGAIWRTLPSTRILYIYIQRGRTQRHLFVRFHSDPIARNSAWMARCIELNTSNRITDSVAWTIKTFSTEELVDWIVSKMIFEGDWSA